MAQLGKFHDTYIVHVFQKEPVENVSNECTHGGEVWEFTFDIRSARNRFTVLLAFFRVNVPRIELLTRKQQSV